MKTHKLASLGLVTVIAGGLTSVARAAGGADLKIPSLNQVRFDGLGGIGGFTLMYLGIAVCFIGAMFGLAQYYRTKKLPVHDCMSRVSRTIWETISRAFSLSSAGTTYHGASSVLVALRQRS